MTSTTPTGAAVETEPENPRRALPFRFVLGLLVGLLLLALTRPALLDVDLYWHIRAGRELLDGVSPSEVGGNWSFAPGQPPWVTTQWLAEVAFAALHGVGGWSAFVYWRAITAAVAIGILAWTTLRARPSAVAALPFLIAATAVISVSQERPQQATIIGAALLGWVADRGIRSDYLPAWWIVLPGTLIWANLHGGWVLVPGVLVLVAVGRMLDERRIAHRPALRALALALASLVAGSITPAGLSGTLAIVRFSDSTGTISEWMPTTPTADVGLLTLAMLLVTAFGWARPVRVPPSEFLMTVCLFVFSWLSWRYVAPALVILAPVVAGRLAVAYPQRVPAHEPRWSTPAGVTAAGALLVVGLATLPSAELLPRNEWPVDLAARIAELPAPQRVLNDYNTSGLVLFFGGRDTQVGVDGRADRYGTAYIREYTSMTNLGDGWEARLQELNPTSALLEQNSPLAYVLLTERGWREIAAQEGWVLLAAPPPAPTG